jgi:hypothetical protein
METGLARRAQTTSPEYFGAVGAPGAAPAWSLGSNRGSLSDPLPRVRYRLKKLRPDSSWTSPVGEARILLPAVTHQTAQGLFQQSDVLRLEFERRPLERRDD